MLCKDQYMTRTPVAFRFDTKINELAKQIAGLEHRSVTNLLETLILERAKKHGIRVELTPKE
jgi:hypothetical protein